MDEKQDFSSVIEKPKSALGVRHAQVLLLLVSMLLGYAMRVNMSVGIVAMTDTNHENTYAWNKDTQSVILSSFFWGYVVLQVPAGELAARFGAKLLLLICIGVNSLACFAIPSAAYYGGWQLVCFCRVVQGLSQGFLLPCAHYLIGKWIPLEEKSFLGTVIYGGGQIGTAIQLMVSGFISEYWGWPAIFYTNGILGAVWCVFYMIFGASTPQISKFIGDEELTYIEKSLGHVGVQKKLKTPWKKIWTSLPFISLIIVHCGQNWGFWTLMTQMPTYMNEVLNVDIQSNGVLTALPYLAMYLMGFPLGYFADFILKKKWLSITASRKLSNSIGHYGPAIALLGLSHAPAGNVTMAVVLLTIVVALNAGHYTGYLLVHIDMAPNFAGTMMGITNCIANFVSIIAPLAAGAMISSDDPNPDDWHKVFYVSSAIYIACNTFFVFFGTSERQSWNEPEDDAANPKDNSTQIESEKAV